MEGLNLFDTKEWQPFSYFNLTHPFFSINADTIIATWLVIALLIIVLIPVRIIMQRKPGAVRYLALEYVRSLINLGNQALGYFSFKHCAFIVSLFTFIATANCIAVIPWIEEPTRDLNTCLALGIISFLYVHYYNIKTHGFKNYLREYFSPLFVMFPLHVLGKISSIISLSFRLFGNIFGGSILYHVVLLFMQSSLIAQIIGLITGLHIIVVFFFIIFEGLLQAFVFTMLTTTFLAIALQPNTADAAEDIL